MLLLLGLRIGKLLLSPQNVAVSHEAVDVIIIVVVVVVVVMLMLRQVVAITTSAVCDGTDDVVSWHLLLSIRIRRGTARYWPMGGAYHHTT